MDSVLHVEQAPLVDEEPSVAQRIATNLEPRAFTYGDLRTYYINIGRPTPGAEPLTQSDKNRLSVLKKWQEALGKTDESAVDGDLDPADDFTQLAEAFDYHLEAAGNKARDRANKKSMLAKWADLWGEFLKHSKEDSFQELHEALSYYVGAYIRSVGPRSYASISRQVGLHEKFIDQKIRLKGKVLWSANNFVALRELEKLVGAPTGALTTFCVQRRKVAAAETVYRSKCYKTQHAAQVHKRSLEAGHYRLNVWPAPLLEEWQGYVRHKTERFPSLDRNAPWRIGPIPPRPPHLLHLGTIGERMCVTAVTQAGFLSTAFGFALLYYKLDADSSELSLSHLLNVEFIKAYVDFMDSRAGRVTRTPLGAIQNITSLIHPKWGYITQRPEVFAARHPQRISPEDWQSFCRDTHKQLCFICKKLKEVGAEKPSRDPQDAIKAALERQHPITYLLEMIDSVEHFLNRDSFWLLPKARYSLERFLFQLRIIVYQPLRVKMFSIMETGEGTKNNLYKRSDDCWAIRFKPEDFKNERGAAQKPYDVAFPKSMTPHVERYLFEVRPNALKRFSPYVFVPFKAKAIQMSADHISDRFRFHTAQFVGEDDCMFGPHGSRHIIATDYIKNNPNGFQVAADVLHDTLETVLKEYAHLKAEDGHKHYQKYLETLTSELEAA